MGSPVSESTSGTNDNPPAAPPSQSGLPPQWGPPAPYGPGGSYPQHPSYAPPPENPGRTLGIVGFIFALVPFLHLVGLVISIVALVKSQKARMGNGFAIAGIIIGALGTILLALMIIAVAAAVPLVGDFMQFCQEAGPGVQEYMGQPVECPPL